MKRLVTAALAFSMMGSPLAMAQQPPPPPPGAMHGGQGHEAHSNHNSNTYNHNTTNYNHNAEHYNHNANNYNHNTEHYNHNTYNHGRTPPPSHYGWGRGYRVPPGHHYTHVNNWHHYRGLYAPPPGQQWVQYNNQFYLVAITSGLIGAVIGAAAASQ